MKMSYHQDNLRRTKNIRFSILLMIVGVVFYFSTGFILDRAYILLSIITTPMMTLEKQVFSGLANLSSVVRSKQLLQAKNDLLLGELHSLKLDIESLELLKQENKELKIQMGRELADSSRSILASVLSGPNIPPYESLIIDVGRDHDISVGDRVIYQPNIVLGQIEQVFESSSKVRLYSASGANTDVLIPAEDSVRAIASGYGGGNFFIDLPNGVNLERGMKLLIPGSDIYILGTIDFIQVDPVTSSQKVLAKYPVNVKNIRFVHVVKMVSNRSVVEQIEE